VLLADFATVKKNAEICDLGTGTGILPILLYGRHEYVHCDAVEIQDFMAEMASRTVKLNNLEDRITVHNCDLRNLKGVLPSCKYSTVVCNPPYKKDNSGEHNKDDAHSLSKHEATCTLDDVCSAANYLLKNGGRFALSHRPERLVDLMCTLRKYGLEPKRMKLLAHSPTHPPFLVLLESVKQGRPNLEIIP
jgi:tRNA1Val (adenine37-N6)-methyltransferase